MNATPIKLKKSWGCKVTGSDAQRVKIDDQITITAKNGKSWAAVVVSVLRRSSTEAICITAQIPKTSVDAKCVKISKAHRYFEGACGCCGDELRDYTALPAKGRYCGLCALIN